MTKSKSISILGCGWLGLPLARYFVEKGYQVKGSTTSPEKLSLLKEAGINPFHIQLQENVTGSLEDFVKPEDILIINFPPKRIPEIREVYPHQLQLLIDHLPATQKVLFVSSTSVYQNTNGEVDESLDLAPEKESGQAVYAAEQLLQIQLGKHLTILRLAGLVGYDRLPGRFLANKKDVKNGDAPINVVHQDDCIGLISAIIEQEKWGEVFNGCADKHPLRRDYYLEAAQKIGLVPPAFAEEKEVQYKLVSNEKSKSVLGYRYKFPDPVQML